jgi:hypothetical protein
MEGNHEEKKMSGSLGVGRLSLGEARLFEKNIEKMFHKWFGSVPVYKWAFAGSLGRYLDSYKKLLFEPDRKKLLQAPDSIGDIDIVLCFCSEGYKDDALERLGEAVGYQKNGKPRRSFEWVSFNKEKQSEFAIAQVDLFITTPHAFGATELFYLAPKSLQEALRCIARYRGFKFSPQGIYEADANQIECQPRKTEDREDVFDLLGVDDIATWQMSKYSYYVIR